METLCGTSNRPDQRCENRKIRKLYMKTKFKKRMNMIWKGYNIRSIEWHQNIPQNLVWLLFTKCPWTELNARGLITEITIEKKEEG
jgi:hypothetical protein